MINFLKKLFGFTDNNPKEKKSNNNKTEYVMDHDMVDYDGMGNQGRFPTHK